MTDPFPTTPDPADTDTPDNLIILRSGRGTPVEMTRENQLKLEREMARTLGNPLAALMAEVANEYRQMAETPARPRR